MPLEETTNDDWITTLLGKLETGVGVVRETATNRVIGIMRTVMYGLMAVIIGMFALVLLAVMGVRLLFVATGHRAWAAHGIVGVLLLIIGFLLLRRRHPKVVA
jgi:hypothetical protein